MPLSYHRSAFDSRIPIKALRTGGLIAAVLSVLLGLGGCGTDAKNALRNADRKTYASIDRDWDNSYGSPTDYTVDPNQFRQAQAQAILEAVDQSRTLGLNQAVHLAVLAGPEYRDAVERMYLTGLDERDAEHLYDLVPFSGASGRYQRNGSDETVVSQANAGVQQLLATGAVVATDLTIGTVDVLTGDLRSGSASIFSAAVVQPLLRGSQRLVVLETLTQAQHDTLYAVREFNRFRKTYCVSVVSDYYRLAELTQRTETARQNIQQLEQLYARIQDLTSVGRLGRFELEQAQQDILQARNEYLDLQRNYDEGLDLFKVRLNIPPQTAFSPDTNDWLMLAELMNAAFDWNEDKAVQVALAQRLDLANTQDRIADAQRKIEVAKDALGADLALVAAASPASGSARSRYEVGLEGSLPLDRVTEANNYRRAEIALTTSRRVFEQQTHQITAQVRKAWRDMSEAKDRYVLQEQARRLARKRLENTTELLRYGRAGTRDVLDAQEDLYEAEDNYITALADFAIAQMDFLRDTETLWILPDGTYESPLAVR